jgi:peroxiredoxin
MAHDRHVLPEGLPAPEDDGAADHLVGMNVPRLTLPSSLGEIALGELTADRAVIYFYPRTGRPGEPIPPGWDAVPGARGCTPQSCGFRDHAAELAMLGARVAGVSAQPLAEQLEFATRTNMPFPIISDETLALAEALSLPTFDFEGDRLLKRLALIAEEQTIVKVFYPVFPPDRNAEDVLEWLSENRGPSAGTRFSRGQPPSTAHSSSSASKSGSGSASSSRPPPGRSGSGAGSGSMSSSSIRRARSSRTGPS